MGHIKLKTLLEAIKVSNKLLYSRQSLDMICNLVSTGKLVSKSLYFSTTYSLEFITNLDYKYLMPQYANNIITFDYNKLISKNKLIHIDYNIDSVLKYPGLFEYMVPHWTGFTWTHSETISEFRENNKQWINDYAEESLHPYSGGITGNYTYSELLDEYAFEFGYVNDLEDCTLNEQQHCIKELCNSVLHELSEEKEVVIVSPLIYEHGMILEVGIADTATDIQLDILRTANIKVTKIDKIKY